ncbi:MAG: hypothetical protein R6U50_14050 [Desulfobacterales bacterium]
MMIRFITEIMQTHRIFVIGAAAAFIGMGSAAYGYVLEGAHILDMYVKNQGKAGNVAVRQRLKTHESTHSLELFQILTYKHPDKYRMEISEGGREWVYARSNGRSVTVIDGKLSDVEESIFERYPDLLIGRSRSALQQHLLELGVDVSISSLGRFNGSVVYVIGARYPDESRPQIWFDKEAFLPVRWLAPDRGGARKPACKEIVFLDWREVNGIRYPMHMKFNINAVNVREIIVDAVNRDVTIPDDQFDIGMIRAAHPRTRGEHLIEIDSGKPSESAEPRSLIENFERMYR